MKASAAPARLAVSVIFFLNGAVLASWIPHIPEIKASHGLSDGRLGLVLLAMAAGAITAMPIAGAMVARFGSRTMTTIAAITFALVLPLPILSPSVPLLAAALFILGAWNGTLDVSMNAHAVAVEQRYGRPIMSSFHALFSLGGLAGAAIAGLAIASGVGRVTHVLIASGVAVAIIASVVGRLLPTAPETTKQAPTFAWPSRALLGLGSLAFLGLLAEGAMADWSAVYLHDILRATPSLAASGFAAFSLAMALGRFSGDSLVLRYGPGAPSCARRARSPRSASARRWRSAMPGSPSLASAPSASASPTSSPFSSAPPATFPASAPASRSRRWRRPATSDSSPARH